MEEELIKILSKFKFNLLDIENAKILQNILNKVDEKYKNKLNMPKLLGYTLISLWPNLEVQKENYDENLIDEINDIYSEFIFDTIVCIPYVTEEDFNTINCEIDKIMLDFANLTMDILLDLRNMKGMDNNKINKLNKLLDDVNLIYNNKDYISKKFVNCFVSFFTCVDANFHHYEE